MASHRLNSLYAIKECSSCGSLYTRECCSIGSLENKILTPVPDSSPCCAKCGTPVDGPYCHGCALLRKKIEEDLLTYCVENGIFQDSQDTSESSDDNTNVINALQEPIVVNQDPGEKSSQEITNDLGIKRFRGEKIDEEYERDCEIRIRKLKQDFNGWGSEVQKKEQAYEEEQYAAARRRMLSIPFVDEDDYIPLGDIIARYSTTKAITPDLPIEEPDNSLNIGDEHLDTISATESDEVIKSSVENLVPILREFEGISNDTCDVPTCDNNRVNVESDLVESLINRDTSIVHSSKIDPILEEFAGELAHIAPIPPGIVEADFDPNDDTSSDDDSFENIVYVDASPSYIEYDSFKEVNDVEQEEKEFDLEDIFQIQDVILREKLLNVHRLISNIESLKVNSTPDRVLKSFSPFPIPVADSDSFLEESDTSLSHLDNSLPEFETFSDHTEETRSGSTTTHANYSLPEYDSFLFEIESDQEGLISNDNSNEPLLELPEFESFHFDPSFPRPPPEPPDVEICLHFEPYAPVIDNFNELNEDQRGNEIIFLQNVEDDDSFTFVIRTFLPFLTYPKASPLSCSTRSEDTIFDPGIITFPFSYPQPVAFSMEVSCSKMNPTISEASRVRCCVAGRYEVAGHVSTRYYSKWRLANQSVTRGTWRVSVRAANDEVRGMGSRANDWREDKAMIEAVGKTKRPKYPPDLKL
ncbi:hypothetical protein Tco_0459464 [Tanacetum coccineum]